MKLSLSTIRRIIKEELMESWAVTKATKSAGQKAGIHSLSGPKFLKPGDAALAVERGEELHGWDKYAQLVAYAYIEAPERTAEGERMLDLFQKETANLHKKVRGLYNINYVDRQPYKSADEMSQKLQTTGEFDISSQFIQSDDPEEIETNLQNRAVHDFFGHLKARGHEKDPSVIGSFTLLGELRAYNNQLKMMSPKVVPLAFTLMVGQVCHEIHFGNFPSLKLSRLTGFDYYNVGRVDGYQISQDGDLIKL